ncbi:MAG: hypothetical protein EA339_11670 [Rhodobacteraceae bacterium]|nr:MAG: hypothetical protein EA339_11670 [Paracoccaceae bacterium]
MRRVALFAGLFVLAACQPMPDDKDTMTDPTSCIAPRLQGSVGQRIATLDPVQLPDPKRIIGPGTAVTMDYRPERLNVQHDAAGIIIRIFCG